MPMSFVAVKLAASAYLALAFFHSWQSEPFRCMHLEMCDKPEYLRYSWEWSRSDEILLSRWRAAWLALAACALLLPLASGALRQLVAIVLACGWIAHGSSISICPPHVPYVSLSCVYLALAGSACDRSSRSMAEHDPPARIDLGSAVGGSLLRAALAVGYGFTGLAKLMTPA